MTNTGPLRVGTLGAARITPAALTDPAREVDAVQVVAIAARDRTRAEEFAKQHGIPRVEDSYADLVEADDLDVIYNPLPISHHCEWTIRALRAGKHVLCEKAIALNAAEAEQMAAVAAETGRALVEAFHYRYHPLMHRVLEIVGSGKLGSLEHMEAFFTVPFHTTDDIRFMYECGGGATMDLGCYPIHMLRHTAGGEPEVLRAETKTGPPKVDVFMRAELRFPGDLSGEMRCAMGPDEVFTAGLNVRGAAGELRVVNPVGPHVMHKLELQTPDGTETERLEGGTTYLYQLRAFAAHVLDGSPVPTGPDDAVRNMRVIDAVYRAAGLPVRGT